MSAAEETAGDEPQPWGEVNPDAARRLLVAAVEAFAERGYHATTTRDIAGRAGMSPAALYIHYKTKEELLHRISRIGHEKALDVLRRAAETEGSPADRLAEAVRSFVRWHAGQHTVARVVQYELDALGPDARAEIVTLRRENDAAVRGIIEDGVAARRLRRARRPWHHHRRPLPLHRRGPLVQRQRPAHPRRGRLPLRGPRAAHGGREEVTPRRRPADLGAIGILFETFEVSARTA